MVECSGVMKTDETRDTIIGGMGNCIGLAFWGARAGLRNKGGRGAMATLGVVKKKPLWYRPYFVIFC